MEYELLNESVRAMLRAEHVRELEERHFELTLHEMEEPGRNAERTRMLATLEERIEGHRARAVAARDAVRAGDDSGDMGDSGASRAGV